MKKMAMLRRVCVVCVRMMELKSGEKRGTGGGGKEMEGGGREEMVDGDGDNGKCKID